MGLSAEWSERSALDPAIDPTRCAPPSTTQRQIFLTGATGFLGAFLLEDLLRTTDARVHCLVRAPSPEAATERLRAALHRFGIAVDVGGGRVVGVAGDLGLPRLGLSGVAFEALGAEIDAIVHCGAQVGLIQGYRQSEPANVGGTLEILRMATNRRLKPVNYISTIATTAWSRPGIADPNHAVARDAPDRRLESDPIDNCISMLRSGYAQSKWVAEKLVTAAMARGVPGRIFRPGYVSGHRQTGVSSLDDNRAALIRVCVESGVAPLLDVTLDMAPVDFAAAAIVAITRAETSLGKVFHVYNPQTVGFPTIVEWLVASGYRLALASREEWVQTIMSPELIAKRDAASRSIPFQAEMEVAWLDRGAPVIDCSNLVEGLAGTGIEIPRIDLALLKRYLDYLVNARFLPVPT